MIGEQLHLRPGEGFHDQRHRHRHPVGRMHGSYHLIDDDGTEFDAPIPPFVLSMLRTLH